MRVVYGQGSGRGGQAGRRGKTDRRTNGQLIRLLVCLGLFLVVYIGKGVFPQQMLQTGPKLLQVIRVNMNVDQALYNLGKSLSEEGSVLGEFGDFCVEVFAPQQEPVVDEVEVIPEVRQEMASEPMEEQMVVEGDVESAPAYKPGDVIEELEADADPLPEGYDPRWLYLGEGEMSTPVMGRITSVFGYRDHPTKGRHAVHNGVDIGADEGQPVSAFMSGTVGELGRNDDFGKYFYIEHDNGVRSFYAHCSAVEVKTGQQVRVGQTVAKVGSTGQSTGPHLHFEVELNGIKLDPMHYIDPTGAGM